MSRKRNSDSSVISVIDKADMIEDDEYYESTGLETDNISNIMRTQEITVKDGKISLSDICTVQQTAVTNEEYEIELEDGTIIKCTPTFITLITEPAKTIVKPIIDTMVPLISAFPKIK